VGKDDDTLSVGEQGQIDMDAENVKAEFVEGIEKVDGVQLEARIEECAEESAEKFIVSCVRGEELEDSHLIRGLLACVEKERVKSIKFFYPHSF
jgi:hypothetical protein